MTKNVLYVFPENKHTTPKIEECLGSRMVYSQRKEKISFPFFSMLKGFASKRFSKDLHK